MDQDKIVKLRFAPSPTGYLHIGGARTALFNWLFARHFGGKFVLRIESTDKERSTPEFVDAILSGLSWLGLDHDEGPFFQHERIAIYRKYADQLVDSGKAYLNDEKGGDVPAVIFKVGKKDIVFDDMLRGSITTNSLEFEELVLMKSDGMPTYNFACVVDDYEMGITHVLRGDDHISNTPKQIALYDELALPKPTFLHLPMILGSDGTRLSKRHNATAVEEYKRQGFLPEAMINYLSLLGWNPGTDQEIFSISELIKCFDIAKISKKSAVFDMEKFKWLNGQYIMQTNLDDLYQQLGGFAEFGENIERDKKIVGLFRERMKVLSEFNSLSAYFYKDQISYDAQAVKKRLKKEKCIDILEASCNIMSNISDDEFTEARLEDDLRKLAEDLSVGAGKLIQAIRVAITGRANTPGLFEVMVCLGKTVVLKRLKEVATNLKSGQL